MRGVLLLLLVGAVVLACLGGPGLASLEAVDVPPVWESGVSPPGAVPGGLPVLRAASVPGPYGPLPAPGAVLTRVEGEPVPADGVQVPGVASGERGDVEYVRGGAER